jgi:NitT/TauT family transport system substrate-binding protein
MSMRDHRQLRARLAAGLLAVVVAGARCGGQATGPAAGRPDLLVAAVPATGAAALYIAADDGLFARAGLRVRIASSVSAADVLAALVHGSVQVSLGQWTSALAAQARGMRLRAVAAGNSGAAGLEQIVTAAGSQLTRPAQLAGKTIAVNALSGLSQMLTEAVLSADGVPPGSLHWVVIPFPEMAAALAGHKVDAAFMIQPYALAAEKTKTVAERE